MRRKAHVVGRQLACIRNDGCGKWWILIEPPDRFQRTMYDEY
jgi:hypothetical protein